MLKLFVTIVLITFPSLLLPQTQFVKAFGTPSIERARCLIQKDDGGYLLGGHRAESTQATHEVLISNCDTDGNLIWSKLLTSSMPVIASDTRPYSLIATSDSAYAMAGYIQYSLLGSTLMLTDNRDFFIMKFDSTGDVFWAKAIGDQNGEDMGISLIQTSDGGYFLTGQTWSFGAGLNDFLIVKLDALGDYKWAKTIGGTHNEIGMCAIQTQDEGYAVLGNTHSYGAGGSDFLLVKLSASGNLIWAKTLGGVDFEAPLYTSLIQSSDKGYVITGYTESFGAGSAWDILIAKFDSTGDYEWAKTVGGTGREAPQFIIKTNDEGYIIAGYTSSFGAGSGDIFYVKLDRYGNLLWAKTIGGSGGDLGFALTEIADRGYAISGVTQTFGPPSQSNIILVKCDANGNSCIGQEVEPTVNNIDPTVLSVTPNLQSVTPAERPVSFTISSYALPETTICEETVSIEEYPDFSDRLPVDIHITSFFKDKIEIYFSSSCNLPVDVSIRNLAGITVYRKAFQSRSYRAVLQGTQIAELPSGVYFIFLSSGTITKSFKIVKIK